MATTREAVDTLRDALAFGTKFDDAQCDSAQAYISNNLGVLAESPVPVEVLIHTARCILSPELLWTHVPDLLDVLAHIEQIRINIVHQAALASEWNTYYAKDPDVGRPTERELERIRAIADTAESKISRSEYYALCRQLRWHHLAHMLVQRDVQNFATLSDMYFPPPNAPEKWYRSYLLDLSDEEKDSEVVQGERIARLAEDSERWREERSSWWKIRIPSMPDSMLSEDSRFFSYERDFFQEFAPEAQLDELLRLTERWLKKVHAHVEMLDDIFTPRQNRKNRIKIPKKKKPGSGRETVDGLLEAPRPLSAAASPPPKEEPSSPPPMP